jgi:hypothetical protein
MSSSMTCPPLLRLCSFHSGLTWSKTLHVISSVFIRQQQVVHLMGKHIGKQCIAQIAALPFNLCTAFQLQPVVLTHRMACTTLGKCNLEAKWIAVTLSKVSLPSNITCQEDMRVKQQLQDWSGVGWEEPWNQVKLYISSEVSGASIGCNWLITSCGMICSNTLNSDSRLLTTKERFCTWCSGMCFSSSTSAKNISVWADWLRQSGRALSEPSETPRWRITPRPASIPGFELHIALPSPFRRFFSLCRSPTLNKHSGIVANCDHTSEWVHCVHACIVIAMHKDPRNCADPRNLAKSE